MHALHELTGVLRRELEVYTDLTDLSSKLQEAIMAGQVREMEGILRGQQLLFTRLGGLERERMVAEEVLRQEQGVSEEPGPADRTLLWWAERLPEIERQPLLQLHEALVNQLERLQSLNGQNEKLIQQSMQYVSFVIELLGSDGLSMAYGQDGEMPRRDKVTFLDRRA